MLALTITPWNLVGSRVRSHPLFFSPGRYLPEHTLFHIARAHPADEQMASFGQRRNGAPKPQRSIEPYVRPEFAAYMRRMQPVIKEAAARHNQPQRSGMTDEQFAEVIALLLYNEHNGWVEDLVEPLRVLTPLYQHSQIVLNGSGLGSNFSVWPTNLRPSVALEILYQQVPVPAPTRVITVPLKVAGSNINPAHYATRGALYAAITSEITQEELAIEYMAVNLERGVYRANYEQVPVSWRTLAAWHNQGIVRPDQVRANKCASDYIHRTSAYLETAYRLIHMEE
jgi:hypothetical protein